MKFIILRKMDDSELTSKDEGEVSQQPSLPFESHNQLENPLLVNDSTNVEQNISTENQTSVEKNVLSSQDTNVVVGTNSDTSTDNSVPPLPPLPKDGKEQLPQPQSSYPADYNMQNYANYNYAYNYNNYYGYPYPQYQWDYNSQQYYQPYQNYYNFNYNANQAQSSNKPPPPPPDAVQLPVEEKPTNKTSATTVDDSNRYSPTAETDDDDAMKGIAENNKSDTPFEQPTQTAASLSNSVPSKTVPQEQIEIQQSSLENIENKNKQPNVSSVTPTYNIPVQPSSYLINSQIQMQPTEVVSDPTNQHQKPLAVNGKDDSTEKISKGSTVLGKNQAKKRLMAFSMMKQKLLEQNNSNNDSQNLDVGEGNDVEFVPEHNVFQTATKKKVVTNKKVVKVIKAQQTIEQIEEMKKDEFLQGNNAALYQHLLRSGGNEAPILQKLGIESLAEKYSAKIREQDKRSSKRHHHRHRDDRRSHKYHRRSHSKSRSRSRSAADKPKMRALDVQSWKDFVSGGFHFDKYRRLKMDEAEEIKEKERKSRSKKRHGDSRSDGKNQNNESITSTEMEKGSGDQKLRYNILDRKKDIVKSCEVLTQGDYTKEFPSYIIQYTKAKPVLKYSYNPAKATCHLQNRHQMLATLLPEIEAVVYTFLKSMKPKRLKENHTENHNYVDNKLVVLMKDKNIYPFKGWWPKKYFIITDVREDPSVEIDKDALINEFNTSKRTKKSRFDDDTSLVDLRPTVPSKWDSDYDGSPIAEKGIDVEDGQNAIINSHENSSLVINRQENNLPDICLQGETLGTVPDIGEEDIKIKVNVEPVPTSCEEPQEHVKLDTEYEKFLKTVSVEMDENTVNEDVSSLTVPKEVENNLSIKSASLNEESVQDESEEDISTKSSDESVSLQNIVEESIDESLVKSGSSVDRKLKKKKKSSNKKTKKSKKKEGKRKKHKSSSSESSQDSDFESDSSSDDSDSDTSDSVSTVEKKKKKKKSKDKKKKKSKSSYKKKHRADNSKTKKPEDEKNGDSILNLLEKAFNVEIKKRPLDDEESKQQKKRRKHEKKENKSSDENEDNFEKVKECLKETITKLVKTDKVSKNPSLSCVDNSVSEVLKYFQIDEEKKNKKSKKSSKRKHNSDVSSDEILTKQSRLAISSMLVDMEKKSKKKKKKSTDKKSDSDEYVSKKKLKKKLKTSDTSGTEDGEGSKYKKSKKAKEPEHFFGLRPNEWNTNKISSMRGVVHQSDVKNTNCTLSELDTSELDGNLNENSCSNSDGKNLGSPNVFESTVGSNDEIKVQLVMPNKSIQNVTDIVLKNIDEKKTNDFRVPECSVSDAKESSINNDIPQTALSAKDRNKQHDLNIDTNNFLKPTENIQNEKPIICSLIKSVGEAISYRDKVKMNLKKLSNYKLDIPFVFGLSTPFALVKPSGFNREKSQDSVEVVKEEVKLPLVDESLIVRSDRPKAVICPQSQNENPSTPTVSPKIDSKVDMEVLDQSYTWEDSDDSSFDQSPVASTSTSENSNDEEECDQIKFNSLENDTNRQQSGNETGSNDKKVTCVATETSSSLNFKNNVQGSEFSGCVNTFDDQILASSYCLSKSEEQFEGDAAVVHNFTESPFNNYDSELPKSSNVNKEYSTTDSELITSWTSDWNKFDKSVTETCNFSSPPCLEESQTKKKSRWDDDESKDNRMTESQEELKDKMKNYSLAGKSENSSVWSYVTDNDFEDQNHTYEFTSDNCINNDYYSGTWSNEYVDSQYYNQSSDIPQYSEIKTIETERLSPVDYSIYENYNPSSYDDNDEDSDLWKLAAQNSPLTTVEQLSTIKVENDLEFLSADHVSNDVTEFSKDENISSPHVENVVVENVKSSSAHRDEQFFQLYQQHFEHYSQNPIKYSTTEPVIVNITDINLGVAETLLTEVLDADQLIDKTIPIPLQARAYVCIVEDNSNKLYITSDNYLAYCASDDKCMVHLAVNSCRRDGLQDKVRHCFNTNENGTADEYWLHADLIPFAFPSDSDSGVLSDEENEVEESDQEDDIVSKNDNEEEDEENDDSVDGDMIEGKWVMVDSDSDNGDNWLDDPRVFDKYRENDMDDVEVTHTDNEREESEASFSDIDTDLSDCTDSGIETLIENQKIVNPIQKPGEIDCKKKLSCIMDEDPFVTVKSDTLSDDKIALSEQLDSNVNTENANNTSEAFNDLTSDVKTENCNDILTEENENFNVNEPCLLQTREIKVEDLTNMYTIVSQQMLIQKLKMQTKEKIQKKLPDSTLVCYSDNMETVKHPFLGLFQPPTISILSKKRTENEEKEEKQKMKRLKFLKLSKRVIFADGIHPGDDLAAASTHDAVSRSFSPPPLKALMRETLKFKHNIFPFKKSKVRTKLTMLNKKVAKVMPSIKCTTSSTEYYISRRHLENFNLLQIPPFLNSDVDRSNNSPYNDDDSCDSSRPTRELTPVPSDNEGWDDGEVGNNIEIDR